MESKQFPKVEMEPLEDNKHSENNYGGYEGSIDN